MHSDLDPIHSLIQLSKDRDDINLLPNKRTQNKQKVNHDEPLWTLEPPNIVSGVRCGNALRISLVALNTLLFQASLQCNQMRTNQLSFLGLFGQPKRPHTGYDVTVHVTCQTARAVTTVGLKLEVGILPTAHTAGH